MTRPLTLRGIACPFNSAGRVLEAAGVVHETVAPGAFEFVGFDVGVRYGDHDGAPIARLNDGSARFFQDRQGLKFEAEVPNTWRGLGAFKAVAAGRVDGCSVNFSKMEFSESVIDGVTHRRITRARIDHITISCGCCYAETAVWPVLEDMEDLCPRLRRLDEEWRIGNSLAQIERRRQSEISPAGCA